LVEAVRDKGLLSVHTDGTTVSDLTLDTQTHTGGAAIFVRANQVSLLRTRVRGSSIAFAVYFAGPQGATPDAPLYNTGNRVEDLDLNDLVCDDGFSWSFQANGSISQVTHTGSRLALYVDEHTTVTGYRYAPGAQQCDARNGVWLTPPADDITIEGFTTSGEGGMLGVIGPGGAGKVATNVTVRGLTMTSSGYRVIIGDVRHLILSDCRLDGNNIVITARAVAQVGLSACPYGRLLRFSPASALVSVTYG
jgi:hypothetical protein